MFHSLSYNLTPYFRFRLCWLNVWDFYSIVLIISLVTVDASGNRRMFIIEPESNFPFFLFLCHALCFRANSFGDLTC